MNIGLQHRNFRYDIWARVGGETRAVHHSPRQRRCTGDHGEREFWVSSLSAENSDLIRRLSWRIRIRSLLNCARSVWLRFFPGGVEGSGRDRDAVVCCRIPYRAYRPGDVATHMSNLGIRTTM